MQIKTIFFFIMFLSTVTTVNGGTIRHDVKDSDYIEYGKKHECVVAVNCKTKDGLSAHGSGVVINPHCVVTAAHVVKDCSDVQILLKGKTIKTKKIVVKKEFEGSMKDNDIALCESEEPMILDFYPKLYDTYDELGKVCSIAGFGVTGTGLTGAVKSDNQKRAGSNIISSVNDDMIFCKMDSPSSKSTSLEYCISHGDSGGGLFIDQKLAGINSMVLANDHKPDSNYGDESGHTRISRYKDWIEDNIKD